MKLRMMARSDVGTGRSMNEDFCGIFEEDGLAIVCDGMGGHNAGASASRLAVATIRYMYLFLDSNFHFQITRDLIARNLSNAACLVGSIRLANRNIYKKSNREPKLNGMGTTVSALAVHDGTAIIAHVGDSRVYRFRQEKMDLLTEDHTWINELIQDQEIDHEEAKKFKKQNVITRALGQSSSIKIDVGIEPIQEGDLFLICTDGLTRALTNEEIKRIVRFNKHNLDHTARHLIDTANIKDGSDNITVALILVEESKPVESKDQSIYLTLGAETKQIIRLEDKILKHELYHRITSECSENLMTKFIKEKYLQLSIAVASLMLALFLGIYAFSNHFSKKNPDHQRESLAETASFISQPAAQHPGNSYLTGDSAGPKFKLNNVTLPDSVINKLITTSLENQDTSTSAPKLGVKSLRKDISNQGRIYLTGLEKLNHLENTSLFINNNYWGKTENCWRKGLALRPGLYTIMIRDSTDNIIFSQKNIKVSAGDVKAIEYRNR